jgi:phytoene dehydrogenase-like protein
VCSAIHPFGRTSPFFVEAALERFGLRWIEPTAALAHPLDDGSAIVVTRDVDATARTLGRDRDAYRRLLGPVVRGFRSLLPDILAPFHIPLRPRRALSLAWFGLNAVQPATWLTRRFRDEPARALMAGVAAHSVLRLDEPISSAAALALLASAHDDGWPFPAGGAGQIPRAMSAALEDLGGSVSTERTVDSLEDLPRSRLALFDTSPGALERVARSRLPARYREKLRNVRYGPSVYKLDVALDGPIPWRNPDVALAGTVHLGGTFEEIEASEAAATRGELHPRPYVLLAQQTLFDRTRAPEGKHTVWAYCHVPHASTADASEAILLQIERFAPGFRERVLAMKKTSPAELEAYNPNDVGGDISGGRLDFRQLFTRPVARLDPYSTPDPRLFLCSSSTPPGGGIHGMCGWHAAHSALRRLDARHD